MRAIWSGTISFGLVTIPVQLMPATHSRDVSFHQLHQTDLARIRYKKFCDAENLEVTDDQIVKAYEYEKGQYVVIGDEDLAAIDPKITRTIDILDFVERHTIDPLYFVKPYYLVPQSGAAKAYRLLTEALTRTGKAAIGQCVIKSKQYLIVIRPVSAGLVMETMRYIDEILVGDEQLDEVKEAVVTDKEVELAQLLIEQMAGAFQPEKYRDEFRLKVLEIVERKVAGREIVKPKTPPLEAAPVIDLVAALKSSLEELKKTG